MTDDIAARLREQAQCESDDFIDTSVIREAADHIDALTRRIAGHDPEECDRKIADVCQQRDAAIRERDEALGELGRTQRALSEYYSDVESLKGVNRRMREDCDAAQSRAAEAEATVAVMMEALKKIEIENSTKGFGSDTVDTIIVEALQSAPEAARKMVAVVAALKSVPNIVNEAITDWDDADARHDARKLLIALAGHVTCHRADIDAIHAAIAALDGEPEGGRET